MGLLNCMRRVIFFLMFLMLASGVLAMSDPISVKTQSGDWVKVYAWPAKVGPLLNLGDGIADVNGTFETTFFSLNVPDVRFTIFVIRGGEKIRDVDFLGHNISEPLTVDCRNVGCEIVDDVEEEEVVVDNESVVVEENEGSVITGNVISDEGGFLNWKYSIGGLVVLLFLLVFVVGMMRHGKSKEVLDGDEKELRYMEKRVRETEDKIRGIKDGRMRQEKLARAKEKLADDEKELKELENGGDKDKAERVKADVESVEDIAKRIRS